MISACRSLTWLDAGEGKRELSDEVVPGRFVVVLHHEADQRQLRRVDDEVQSLVPDGVEPWRSEVSSQVNTPPLCRWVDEFRTVVVDVAGLLLGLVLRDAVDLHSDQRVHDGSLLLVDLGQLLRADHLPRHTHTHIHLETHLTPPNTL